MGEEQMIVSTNRPISSRRATRVLGGACAALLALTALPLAPAHALVFTWVGQSNVSSDFQDVNNWVTGSGTQIPGASDLLRFQSSPRRDPYNANSNFSTRGIQFFAGSLSNTIGGQRISIGSAGITNFGSRPQTINTDLFLTSNQTWNQAATTFASNPGLNINGAVATNGRTLTFNAVTKSRSDIDGVISGSGSLHKTNSGTLQLGGNNTYSGATRITGGTLRLGDNNRIADVSKVDISNGATFDLNNFVERVGGLSGAGNVELGENGARGLIVDQDTDSTFSGEISGVGTFGLTKDGAGTLTLSGANDYTGATNIAEGTLKVFSSERISDLSAVNISAGAKLDLNNKFETIGGLSGAGDVSLGGSGGGLWVRQAGDTIFSGVIGGNIPGQSALTSLTKDGSGELTLGGANEYTGATVVLGGTLKLGANSRIDDSSKLRVNGGATFDLNGFEERVAELSGDGKVALGSSALRGLIVKQDTNTTFSGEISGDNGLVKEGTGRLTLDGTNTYSGSTTVSDGTLRVANTASSFAGAITNSASVELLSAEVGLAGANQNSGDFDIDSTSAVTGSGSFTQSGGSLTVNGSLTQASVAINGGTLGGSGTIRSALTVAGGTVGPGNSPGLLTIFGDADFMAGSTLAFELGGLLFGTGYDRIDVADDGSTAPVEGTATIAAGTQFDIDFFGGFTAGLGDEFDVLVADEIEGALLSMMLFDFTGATLGTGLTWDFNIVDFGGGREALRLSVASTETGEIPAPPMAALFVLCLAGLGYARRKRVA